MRISEVQEQLKKINIDGWLLYDFQDLNPIAKKLLGLKGHLLTRRWYYWIPKQGPPLILCHRIEQHSFSALTGQPYIFKSWTEMQEGLQIILQGHETVAMEYSPQCSIPYVSRVDAGTIETVKGLGKKVVSSANLVQYFEARWSEEQLQMHQEASRYLMHILFDSFRGISHAIKTGEPISEFTVQQDLLEKYRQHGLISFSAPIVAVNENTGNPHYEPKKEASRIIKSGDFVLIDLWAKLQKANAVYADYTWVGYTGEMIPEHYVRIWEVVRAARDAALDFVEKNYLERVKIQGWEVDSVARDIIGREGYGEYFVHRTGHSIGEDDHGNGANMDSLETKDERLLIPHTCFSIEPGIYLNDFGIRSEVNVYLNDSDVIVTGDPIQKEIVKILP